MLACVLMMMHCGQISRDSGINPVFIFAFYGTITYFMQMCGYLVGYASGSAAALGVEQLSFVALGALYVMLRIALVGRKVGKLHTNRLAFLMLTPKAPQRRRGRDRRDAGGALPRRGSAQALPRGRSLPIACRSAASA